MNQSAQCVQHCIKTFYPITLLAVSFLGFSSPSKAALPGALTFDIAFGKNSNSITSSSWNSEALKASASQGLTSPRTGQNANGLGIGATIGYVFHQFELPFSVLNTGIEAGFRTLGNSARSVDWSGGSNETMHNNLNMAHLALSMQIPIAQSPVFWIGKVGVGVAAEQTRYSTNIARVSNFTMNQDAAEPYLATGLAFGNNRMQFQILAEHMNLPALPNNTLASGQSLNSQSSLNLVSLGLSLAL